MMRNISATALTKSIMLKLKIIKGDALSFNRKVSISTALNPNLITKITEIIVQDFYIQI